MNQQNERRQHNSTRFPGSARAARRRPYRLCEGDPLRGRRQDVSAGAADRARHCSCSRLHAADGTPIMLTDSREAAVANAWSQELEAVSVH